MYYVFSCKYLLSTYLYLQCMVIYTILYSRYIFQQISLIPKNVRSSVSQVLIGQIIHTNTYLYHKIFKKQLIELNGNNCIFFTQPFNNMICLIIDQLVLFSSVHEYDSYEMRQVKQGKSISINITLDYLLVFTHDSS